MKATDTSYCSTLGLKWNEIGTEKPPTGTEIQNEALASALVEKVQFTKEELNNFNFSHLSYDCYIKAGDCTLNLRIWSCYNWLRSCCVQSWTRILLALLCYRMVPWQCGRLEHSDLDLEGAACAVTCHSEIFLYFSQATVKSSWSMDASMSLPAESKFLCRR